MFVQEENLCVCNKQKVSAMPCNEHINCSPDFVNVSPKNHLQIMGRYVDVVS